MVPTHGGDIWVIVNDSLKLLKKRVEREYSWDPFEPKYFNKIAKKFVVHFEYLDPYKQDYLLIGTPKGFIQYHENGRFKTTQKPFNVLIRKVEQLIDNKASSIFKGVFSNSSGEILSHQPKEQQLTLASDNQNANIRFYFAATYYEDSDKNMYSYRLKGLEDEWSEWADRSEKDYTNLSPGSYVFQVKAKNIYDQDSGQIAEYAFSIQRDWLAILGYGLIIIVLLAICAYLIRTYLRHKLTQNVSPQEFTSETARQEINEIFKLIIRSRKDIFKPYLDVLSKLEKQEDIDKTELIAIRNTFEAEFNPSNVWLELMTIVSEKSWYKNLNDQYGEKLTPKEKQYCVLARAGYTNNEAAALMNLGGAAIDFHRRKLRDKFGLDKGSPFLTEFLLRNF